MNQPTDLYERVTTKIFGSRALPERRFNIGALVDSWAATRTSAPAVISGENGEFVLTYGDLALSSGSLASALRQIGVQRGHRVVVSLPQGPECAITHAAVLKLGAVSMPLSRQYGPQALSARIRDALPTVVVCQAGSADLWRDVFRTVGHEATLVLVADGSASRGTHQFTDLISRGRSVSAVETSRDDPALLLYTSGTSGSPKGVLHAHRVVPGHSASLSLAHNLYPRAGAVVWSPADWSWSGGLVNCLLYSWWTGTPIVAAPARPFDVDLALNQMEATGASAVFLPPTALRRMRAEMVEPRRHELRLTSILTGSEALGADLQEWCIEYLGIPPNEVYGQTEASAVVGNCALLLPVKPGSMGVPYPGARVQVLDSAGQPVEPGATGEIAISTDTDSVFLGYWQNPADTEAAFGGPDGQWLLTGDMGTVDEDGYLWFDARVDDVIISSGYRIGPTEIETCLRDHPAVADAAVVGLPDDIRGSVVAAFVEMRDDQYHHDDLRRELSELTEFRLARFQRPRVIEVVDLLPRTTTGKVLRRDLRNRRPTRKVSLD